MDDINVPTTFHIELSLSLSSCSRPQLECEKGYVVIPRTKLYYLAPEILKVLCPCPAVTDAGGDLYPYSERTDVFAFR